MANEKSLQEYKARIQRAVDHVEKNIADRISLAVLAEVSCFSSYHFHRIFHAFVGETPGEFVNRIRLEKAASRLITYPSEQITEIVFKCGFASSPAFARAFREYFGCSASEWRGGRLEGVNNGDSGKANDEQREISSTSSACRPDDENSRSIAERMEEMLVKTEIKSMPSFHLAYLECLHGYNEKIGKFFDRLCRWAGPRGLLTDDARFIGIAPYDPKAAASDKCRHYACMTVPAYIVSEEEIGVADIPAARCVVARFEGVQGEIAYAYDELFGKFIPENGYQPADLPAYEIYYNDPQNASGKEFTLDLCVPVESWKPCQGSET